MRRLLFAFIFLVCFGLLGGCNKTSLNSNAATGQPEEETPAKPAVNYHGDPPTYPNICMDAQNRRVPIIMFHDLVPERTRDTLWYDCSLEEFQAIIDAIDIEGMTVISLDELYDHLTTGKDIPIDSIVLTFDDNYQSFYDLAWPILKEKGYPSSVFVHTGFVGRTDGRAKMSWDTLKILAEDPLCTIGGHTINHFLDLKDRDLMTQREELTTSKADLESHLGVKIDYLAYPNGSNGLDTQSLAEEAGYKMAFTIEQIPAEESPNIFAVGRYVHTKFAQAVFHSDLDAFGSPADVFRMEWNKEAKVEYVAGEFADVPLKMTFGGKPSTVMSMKGREPVKDFVIAEGAVAGINGGFFAMAAVASTDNAMVGPLKTEVQSSIVPDMSSERWPKITGRPLVIWSDHEFALLPYIASQMNLEEQFQYFMKGYTDCFMGGVWLVHNGIPRDRDEQNVFGAKDIQDYRRRAFIGIAEDGRFVAGAATASVSSEKLAKAIAEAGVLEAVLIDSGFSTSLVFNNKIKASGHSNKEHPSRPVPHAIVIKGVLDETTDDDTDLSTKTSLEEDRPKRRSRR